MKVGSKITDTRRAARAGRSAKVAGGLVEEPSSPLTAEVLERVTDGAPSFIACAPGRLDVMGGLAAYAGSLVLSMPVANHVCVGVQPRTDGRLSIVSTTSLGADGSSPTVIPMSKLRSAGGESIDASRGLKLVDGARADATACVVGTVVEMLREGMVSELDDGLSVVVASTLHDLVGVGRDAALIAATTAAVAEAYGVALDPVEAAALAQRVENLWLCLPVGFGDAVCALVGESDALTEVRCEPRAVGDSIRIPDNLVLLGIDCGTVHTEARIKYRRVRTAAFMGRALVDRIIRHDGAGRLRWGGYLSQISIADYVDRFRDRLPTKLKGSEYLERFGETGDPLTRIDPDFVYKIRSRTEHHIYEHARACQFVQCLRRAIRNADRSALVEAGELMYASHWSYGQRCGLGSVETDWLVGKIRKHGIESDVYGAKVTAGGCGAAVAVLMQATDRAQAAVDSVLETYQAKTGRKATLIRGSSPGALVRGVRRT